MKTAILILGLALSLFARELVVFENEYNILKVEKPFVKVTVGNQELLSVSLLDKNAKKPDTLKIYGKKSGNTSLLIL